MSKFSLKSALLVILAVAMTGCKLAVIVVEGGEVRSTYSGTCQAGTSCIHEVVDTNYREEFTAFPDAGWHFEKWNTGGTFLCPNLTDPTCVVTNVAFAFDPNGEAVVASEQTFYIMPVFKPGPTIIDTVTVNGREWAQPDLFNHLTWQELDAVCPAGACIAGGMLNGYDVSDWVWATVDDVNDLFNTYIGPNTLGPGPSELREVNASWAPQLFDAGFNPTAAVACGSHISGLTSDELFAVGAYWGSGNFWRNCFATDEEDHVGTGFLRFIEDPRFGAWFYRK